MNINKLTGRGSVIGVIALIVFGSHALPALAALSFQDGFNNVESFLLTESGVKDPGYDPNAYIIKILNIILSVLAIIAVIAIIYAGILMIIDMGEEDNMKKGKNIIKYAIIGLVIIGFSTAIVNVIINTVIK